MTQNSKPSKTMKKTWILRIPIAFMGKVLVQMDDTFYSHGCHSSLEVVEMVPHAAAPISVLKQISMCRRPQALPAVISKRFLEV